MTAMKGLGLFSLVKRVAKKRSPIRRGDRLEFRIFSFMKGLAINAFFTFLTVEAAATDREAPSWLPLVFLAMFAGAMLASPAPARAAN